MFVSVCECFVSVCDCLCGVGVCLCGVGVGFTVSVWGVKGFGLVMFGAPGTALPRTALPGTALPGTALPGTALPGTALPGTQHFPKPPKISLFFFFLSRRKIRSFFPSLGVFSLNFGGVLKTGTLKMCTFGLSGCIVKPGYGAAGWREDNTTQKAESSTTQEESGWEMQRHKLFLDENKSDSRRRGTIWRGTHWLTLAMKRAQAGAMHGAEAAGTRL